MINLKKKLRVPIKTMNSRSVFSTPVVLKLLPLLIGVILFFVIHSLMQNTLAVFGATQARQFKSEARSIFLSIGYLSSEISYEVDLQADSEDEESASADPMQLCDELRRFRAKNSFLKDFYVISDDYPYILSSSGCYTYDSLDVILSMIGETQDSFASVTSENAAGWHIGGNVPVAPYYITPIAASRYGIHGQVLAVLNSSALPEIFREDNVALSCLFNDNYYISSRIGSGTYNIDWHSDAAVSTLLNADVKCFYSNDESFSYMVAIPTSFYYTPSRTIALYFAAYLILIVLLEILRARRLKRKQLIHLSKIMDMLPKPAENTVINENYLALVEQALVKYRGTEERYVVVNRSSALRDILSNLAPHPLSGKILPLSGLVTTAESFYVATFFADSFAALSLDGNNAAEDLTIEIIFFESALRSAFSRFGEVSCCKIDRQISCVFSVTGDSPENFDETIGEMIIKTANLIESSYGLNIFTTLSARCTDYEELNQYYKQTVDLYVFAQSIGMESSFLTYNDMRRGGELMPRDNFFLQLQVIANTLRLEKFSLVPDMVDALLKSTVVSNRDPSAVKNRLECVSAMLAEAVLLYGGKDRSASAQVAALRNISSVSELNKICTEVFPKLSNINTDSDSVGAVDRACSYIKDNIGDPNLNVPRISESVGLSTQHLSRLFRKQLNNTIAEYVNEYRVTAAKRLILRTNLPISRIAAEVGYISSDSFYRNFKKVEGATPAEFRKMYQN